MGLGGIIGAIPSLIGVGGSIAGLFGGDESSQAPSYASLQSGYSPPATFNPSLGAQQAPYDQMNSVLALQGGAGMNNVPYSNPYADLIPSYNLASQGIYNNLFGPQAMQGAHVAASLGGGIGQGQIGAGGALMGMGNTGIPYASQILNTGFDPEGALRAREEQRLSDSTLAALNRSGVGTTPYGQGVLGQTMANFGLDWQDRALGRMNTATTGYGNLVNAVGRGFSGGADLQNTGLGTIVNSAALPYQTQLAQANNTLGAFDRMAAFGQNAWNMPQSYLSNLSNLMANQRGQLGLGLNSAQAGANYGLGAAGYGLNANAQNFNQNQIYGANLGSSLSGLTRGLGNIFSGTGWSGNGAPTNSSLGSTGLGFTFS